MRALQTSQVHTLLFTPCHLEHCCRQPAHSSNTDSYRLKCNRQEPCARCVRHGQPSACQYVPSHLRLAAKTTTSVPSIEKIQDQSSMNASTEWQRDIHDVPDPTHSSVLCSDVAHAGRMEVTRGGTTYVGGSHWATVAHDVTQLPEHHNFKNPSVNIGLASRW